MPVRYRSRTVKKETLHTVSLLTPHLEPGASVLDIGCGEGYVLDELIARGVAGVQGVDIVDIRRNKDYPVSPLRRRDAAVSRPQLRPGRPQLRAAPRPQRAKAGAARGGAARQPRQDRHRRGHAGDGVRPGDEPPPRRVVPAEDPQHGGLRLPDRGRMALAVPRHGAGTRGARRCRVSAARSCSRSPGPPSCCGSRARSSRPDSPVHSSTARLSTIQRRRGGGAARGAG